MSSRAHFLAAGASALALAAPLAATGQALIPLNVATTPNDSGGEVFYAIDMVFFRKAGLDVTPVIITNGATIGASIIAGTLDFAQASIPSIASGHERGLPFTIVSPAAQWSSRAVTTALVVAKTSAYKTPKDLEGKTIAVNGALTQVGASAWLDKNHVDTTTVKFIDMPYGSMAPALAAKRIDAAVLVEPSLDEALATDARTIAAPYDAIAPDFLISAWFTTTDYVKKNPDTVRRFVSAMLETARWANRNPTLSAPILEKYNKVPVAPNLLRVVYGERSNPALAQPLIDAAARYKQLRAPFPASEIFLTR
jgi:ABC-type nitrate/sulfonate/bicarbonate transport system substrate-binding protein